MILEQFPYEITFEKQTLRKIIYEAYSTTNFLSEEIIPLKQLKINNQLNSNVFIMEEFYGQTSSFKDLALEFFSRLFEKSLSNQKYIILVATSGDTGSAVLNSFTKLDYPVVVLYPNQGVSHAQQLHMTSFNLKNTNGKINSKVIGIEGNFDNCQNIAKSILNDEEFKSNLKQWNFSLSSANSISWGRLIPQIIYTVNSYFNLVKLNKIKFGEKIDICIPTGNFGNILGAYIAKKMGLPINKLICSSNEVSF